jgi:hypothetical protein
MIYEAEQLKKWDTDTEIEKGKWVSARPMRSSGLWGLKDRMKTAWKVLTGECDGVRWYKQ